MQMCSDGGGGGNGSTGGDGLVNPAGLIAKSADLDTTQITGAATKIRAMGSAVDTQTDGIATEWSTKLPGCYHAPEQASVYALMTDPATASETLKTTFNKMAGFLDTYAADLEKIKPKISDWETRAQAFRDRVIGGVTVDVREAKDANLWTNIKEGAKDFVGAENETKVVPWYEDGDTVDENKGYIDEIARIYAEVSTAASTCATDINGLTSLPADKKEVPPIPKEAFTNPENPMPWGYAREEDRNCNESVGHGAYEFGKGTLEGLGSLISYNPETGDWGDWGHAGQAWMGTGNLVMSLVVSGSPVAWAVNGVLKATGNGDSAVSKWIDERNKMSATVGASLVGIDLTAKDPFHKWKEDGVATFTESALNIGTMFIPGAGQVGAGLKAASIGARVAKITSVVADFAVPGGSWLVKGGMHVIPGLKNFVKFGDNIPLDFADDITKAGAKLPGVNPAAFADDAASAGTSSTRPVSDAAWGGNGPDVDAPRTGPATTEPTAAPHPESSARPAVSPETQPTKPAANSEPTAATHPEGSTTTQPESTTTQPESTTTQPESTATQPESTATQPEAPTTTTHPEGSTTTQPEPLTTAHPEPTTTTHPDAATATHPDAATHPEPDISDPGNSAAADITGHGSPGHVDTGAHAPVTHHDPTPHTESHPASDPEGTVRHADGALRDAETGRYAADPNRPTEHGEVQRAEHGDSHYAVADDPGLHEKLLDKRRDAAATAHHADEQLREVVAESGVDPEKLKGPVDEVSENIQRLRNDGVIDRATARRLEDAVTNQRVARQSLIDASRELGEQTTPMVAGNKHPLIDVEDAGAGRFDYATIGGDPPSIDFWESKGGNGRLGERTVDGVRVEQGTAAYLLDIARTDPRLAENLQRVLDDPAMPQAVKDAINSGEIQINYKLSQALPDGRIRVTDFVLKLSRSDKLQILGR